MEYRDAGMNLALEEAVAREVGKEKSLNTLRFWRNPNTVVIGRSQEIKKEVVFILGYCNEIPAYIPSARMISEGGYEVERSLPAFSLPTPFMPGIEETIVEKVKELWTRML